MISCVNFLDPNKSLFEEAQEKLQDFASTILKNQRTNDRLINEYREVKISREDSVKIAMAGRDVAPPPKVIDRDGRRSIIEHALKRPSEV